MSNSTPPSQSIFLYPARITLATAPIIGADYGVLRAIYDLMPMGCEVVVDAFLGQQGGEVVQLNLNGQTNIARATTQGTSDSVKLYIPHGLLIPGIVNRMTYTVMRGSSNQGTSEPPVEIIYNKEGPGEQDVTPGDGANSSLKLLLPKEITDGVGPGFTEAIVCVEYAWCRAYDRIRLNCNGHDVFHTVTENQAPPPPAHGSATPTRICFKVTSADLKDDPEFNFSFTVKDQPGNGPDSDAPWSAVETVVVDQAGLLLRALILRELLSDALDPSETFDLSKAGTEFWAIILTNDPRFEAGHSIVVTLVIKNPGKPDVTLTGTGTVEVDEFGQNKPCPVKFGFDPSVIVAGAQINGTYKLLNGEQFVASSRAANIQVIGNSVPELVVDTSDLQLYGQNVSIYGTELPWIPTGIEPDHTTAERKISGGVPPYAIQSSDEGIASTHGNLLIRSEGNGDAIITIKDAANQQKTINVKCANVRRVLHNPSALNHAQAVAWVRSVNGIVVSQFETDIWILTISKKYIGPLQILYHLGNPAVLNSCISYNGNDHPTAPSKWWSGFTGDPAIFPVICFKQ